MRRRWLIALIVGAVLMIPLVVSASVQGKLIQLGIVSDGQSTVFTKDVTAGEDLVAVGDVTSGDDVLVGDDCVITGLATVGETLVVTGATTLTGAQLLTGNTACSGTVTVTGAVVLRSTLAVTGASTLTGATTVTGVLDANSTATLSILGEHTERILSFTGSKTLTAAMSGAIISNQDAASSTVLTLPTAVAGLTYTFLDVEAAAGSDLWITAGASDKINGGTAGKSYKCTGDAVKQHVTIVAIDDELWEITAENGTFANDNN